MKKGNVIKVWFLAVFMGVLLTGLVGCGFKNEKARTLEKGVLKVGMNLNVPYMSFLSDETNKPEGFDVDIAENLAKKMGIKLEIIDTSEKNLLKSLDGEIYDCAISAIGTAEWNEHHYSCTDVYADISSVEEEIGFKAEYPEIAVFTKKDNLLVQVLDEKLRELKKDGTLRKISQKYFEKDITIK